MKRSLVWLVAAACSIGSATCSQDPGVGNGFLGGEEGSIGPCPSAPIECPESDPAPTYTEDVAPVLDAHCTGCHGPGGENQDVPLTSYRLVSNNRTAISNVLSCTMPPAPLPRLSDDERATLVCWYARGKKQ
jgi:hypothetical protein